MRIVALDTTTRAGSVALLDDDRVVEERPGNAGRTHAERLPGELLDLLSAYGLTPRDVDLYAVAAGPGSFTGLRIGIATMQGLAFTTARPVIAVSTLDALGQLAAHGLPEGARVGAWVDANRGEVFSALYRVAQVPRSGLVALVARGEPAVADPVSTLGAWTAELAGVACVMGDGAARYAEVLAQMAPSLQVRGSEPLAGMLGRIARARWAGGERGEAADVRPLYVRRPDAEIERERRR